ncbi:capsular polysaccharide biosynthesis protein [Vibrio nigripulchritudo]|uniref:sugar transferase n=1 Tax=Vibrio nigripulchritudo TaxID=28173 RepID=UPI00190DD490|nr:sugar transferase [Vibrio nigripulchritudo]BCL71458.1 capsular polysaccharide biosynthesis protein [Vibrio nigripulchritudo]BDU32815.1 capsular polysaccharide biosynthesis protein [Vibrio nigripulchritudo]
MKRTFDIVISLVAIFLLSPILVGVSILIWKNDRGSVFFRQQRVGLNGKEFCILKFRSMVENAPELGGYQTLDNDNRITKVGVFIRKTSIDELPQFFNVLKGDMSIVGPRPNVLAQRDEYDEWEWNVRNSVRPGITGLAQAKGRSSLTPARRTKLDLEYAESHSLMKDISILILTVKQVITQGGN